MIANPDSWQSTKPFGTLNEALDRTENSVVQDFMRTNDSVLQTSSDANQEHPNASHVNIDIQIQPAEHSGAGTNNNKDPVVNNVHLQAPAGGEEFKYCFVRCKSHKPKQEFRRDNFTDYL